MQPIHELHGSKLNCTFSLGSTQVLMSWSLGTCFCHRCTWVQKKGIPIIRILYLSPLSVSISCFMAMNSAPKTEVSIVACCFDSQMIGPKLQKMIHPVWERLVLFSPAWLLSTIIPRSMSLPRGGGMSGVIASSTLPKNSVHSKDGKAVWSISGYVGSKMSHELCFS